MHGSIYMVCPWIERKRDSGWIGTSKSRFKHNGEKSPNISHCKTPNASFIHYHTMQSHSPRDKTVHRWCFFFFFQKNSSASHQLNRLIEVEKTEPLSKYRMFSYLLHKLISTPLGVVCLEQNDMLKIYGIFVMSVFYITSLSFKFSKDIRCCSDFNPST